MSVIKYQPHIDGLRAIAVLSVIIFHLNTHWLPGGFVGVDFFFVISGFLITSIILSENHKESFTFQGFYLRRLRRIFPVLSVVVITCFIAGYLLFLNYDFRYLRRSTQSTWFFYSNVFFMGEGDYFSPNLLEAPLLHTWSLSIEEQFYFIWPAILLVTYKLKKEALIPVSIALITLSFGFSVAATFVDEISVKSYFLLPSRFWELLLGGLLAMLLVEPRFVAYLKARPLMTTGIPYVACILLVYSVFFIGKDNGFPGYAAAFPCFSAVLFILSGFIQPAHFVVRCLQTRVMVFIGLLSYSLYLWHWPILAFIRYVTIDVTLSSAWIIFAVALTLALSILSYQFVEKPFRNVTWSFKKAVLLIYIGPLILVTLLDLTYKKLLDKATLHHSENPTSEKIIEMHCPEGIALGCKIGQVAKDSRVVLIGDSHAEHLVPFFDKIAKTGDWSLRVFSKNGCVNFLGVPDDIMTSDKALKRKYCPAMQDSILQSVSTAPHTIIFSSRWSIHAGVNDEPSTFTQAERRSLFEDGLLKIVQQGHTVMLVSEIPSYNKSIQRKKAYPHLSSDLVRLMKYKANNSYLKALADRHDKIFYIDLSQFAEQFEGGAYHGKYMYFDSNHLTYEASLILADIVIANGVDSIGLNPLLFLNQVGCKGSEC